MGQFVERRRARLAGGRLAEVVARGLAPHWGALLALGLFLIAGLIVVDDYGVTLDEPDGALRSAMFWAFFAGANDVFAGAPFYLWIYGPAFDLALLFVERSLGIEGSRDAYLSRHLLMHLSFLTGGLFAYLLACRLSGNRLVGLVAMLIFLLHPRLYAHSFFNGKDIPFLALFAVALYLTHRAFRRDALLAFALLGAAVGALVSMRIMGLILFAAVPTLRALDFAFASGWAERKRILVTAGAFALTAGLAFFVLLPHLWADPVGRAAAWWATLSDHPQVPSEFFRGTLYRSVDFPFAYVPVWFTITGPPFALLLGAAGAGAVLVRGIRSPGRALRNTRLRFAALLVGALVLPVGVAILLDANISNGWRQMYFLWAPFALLAAVGVGRLASMLGRARLRAAAHIAVGAGLAAAAASMALIHPNQQVFFNFSVDRTTPERLRTQYVMDYWGHSTRQALEWLASNPGLLRDAELAATGNPGLMREENAAILPDAARERLSESLGAFAIGESGRLRGSVRSLHEVKVYGSAITSVERKDDLRAVYEAARGREPLLDASFDFYRLDGSLALVKEPCAPSFLTRHWVIFRVTPEREDDLPPWRAAKGFESLGFPMDEYGALLDGKCVASVPLPGYPIAEIEIVGPLLMDESVARRAALQAMEEGPPLARSDYDVYLGDGELVLVQEACDPAETEHPFFLDAFPTRASDLPEGRRAQGFERSHFAFHQRGAFFDGACGALPPLPDYPVAAARTGQRTRDGGDLWSAEFSLNPAPYRAAHRAVAGSEPLARGVFDLYLLGGDFAYVKEPCARADTEARFFLHVVPERVDDLPEGRRRRGFDNLDFDFFRSGALFDGKCAARVTLPAYPIASVRTGQFVAGAGEVWRADVTVGFPLSRE